MKNTKLRCLWDLPSGLGGFSKNLRASGKFLAFLGLILSSSFFSSPAYAQGQHPVKFQDVKSWKSFGPLWAGGYDSHGKLLAIYDLSFPTNPLGIPIGNLDLTSANFHRTVQFLKKAQSSGTIKGTQLNQLTQAIQTLEGMKADRRFSIPEEPSDTAVLLPANWWQSIPWRQSSGHLRFTTDSGSPSNFYLSDIDFLSAVNAQDREQFTEHVNKMGPGFFEQFEFKATAKGYQIFFHPQASAANPFSLFLGQPQKMIDFQCSHCGMTEGLAFEALGITLGGLTSLIPIPAAGGLLNLAITEFFNFTRELALNHEEMALEMLQTSEEQQIASILPSIFPSILPGISGSQQENASNPPSPFNSLSMLDRNAAITYLVLAESELMTSLKWIKTTPLMGWAQVKSAAASQAANSEQYLVQHGDTLSPINPRFAIGIDRENQKRIYSLAANRYWNILPPFVAVDYSQPDAIFEERAAIEIAYGLILFLKSFIPIPGVGSIISEIYNVAIESQMHSVQHWESRLRSQLFLRSASGDNRKFELDLLYAQQINPFELSPEDVVNQMEQLKNALRIQFNLPVLN